MMYGPCDICPGHHEIYGAKTIIPCCQTAICDRCLTFYLKTFWIYNLPLNCPVGCKKELGLYFFYEIFQDRPEDSNPHFLKLKEIYKVALADTNNY